MKNRQLLNTPLFSDYTGQVHAKPDTSIDLLSWLIR